MSYYGGIFEYGDSCGVNSVILGSSLAIAHSGIEFIQSFKNLNLIERLRKKQLIELILDKSLETSISLFIMLIIFIVPIFIDYALSYEAFVRTGGKGPLVIIMLLVFKG